MEESIMSNYDFQAKSPADVYSSVKKFLPYKISKKIEKTKEARTGTGIYKRRNRRDYRVIIQYSTWKKMMTGSLNNILSEYSSGYAISIPPSEYFGDNYPNRNPKLNSEFSLGENGFVYYTLIGEYNQYPPLDSWSEVIEFDTKSTQEDFKWKGEYALNIKNTSPSKLSLICYDAKKDSKDKKKEDVEKYIGENFPNEEIIDKFPNQSGLGNYDFDYASPDMQTKVELQMLLLIFSCRSVDGSDFPNYLLKNKEDILEPGKDKDRPSFISFIDDEDNYITSFNEMYIELKNYCKQKNLLDYSELQMVSAINNRSQTICPLCRKPIYLDDFFKEKLQAEGRQVLDNTQREIVLMHIEALRSGYLNHRIYNLGWGHNFCNLIQGDKSLSETIVDLREIIKSHEERS